MSFRILIISSMYPDYLENFHRNHPDLRDHTYEECYDLLMDGSTEFTASYTRNFKKKGVDAISVIANDSILRDKWVKQYGHGESNKILLQQVLHYKPDVLWVEDLRFMDIDTLDYISTNVKGIRLKILCHCAPLNSSVLRKLRYFDHVITCTPGLADQFRDAGIKSSLVYHGFDEEFLKYCTVERNNLHDVVFSGSLRQGRGYHSERIQLLDYLLKSGIDISLFASLEGYRTIFAKKVLRIMYKSLQLAGIEHPGKVWGMLEYGSEPVIPWPASILKALRSPVFGAGMYSLLAGSRVVINNHGEVAGEFAGNMRLFEATGSGSCLLTENKLNIGELFEPGREIVVYDSREDCAEKLKWLLSHEDERRSIAEAGQARTLSYHKVSDRSNRMLEIVSNELNGRNI